jgi:UDP-N-acetylmuramyl tripeptide synthase
LTFAIKTKTADLTPEKFAFKTQLLGGFNQANCLAAIGAGRLLGVADEVIRKAVATFAAPPGRMEVVRERPCKIIVDFAHTPQAFQNVLPVIRDQVLGSRNKLIHVFGCTGDRDKSKRPIMGRIAAGYDDVIILTSEDTYSEGAEDIIRQIEEGVRGSQSARDNGQWIKDNRQENGEEGEGKRKCYYIILDRREAIKKALALARPGDVVLLTGVGHQKSLNMGGKEVPWSERGTVEELLRNKK